MKRFDVGWFLVVVIAIAAVAVTLLGWDLYL